MKSLWPILGCLTLLVSVSAIRADGDEETSPANPRVKMETSLGDIVLELDIEKAPITVHNFLRYTSEKYYDGTIFHRVMPGFMIQGGGFTPDIEQKTSDLHEPIKLEARNGLSNVPGTIAMARTRAPDSATSQFFINVVDNSAKLDYPSGGGYAVFGKVVEGMDTVEKIRNTDTENNPKYPGGKVVPKETVLIKSVVVLGDYKLADAEAAVAAALDKIKAEREAAKAAQKVKMQQIIKKTEEETGKKIVTTDSGLTYVDLVVGEGATPEPTDQVTVHYTGWLTDGTEFDSSHKRGQPVTFPLNRVIAGWTEGVGSMKVGGKRKLIIPSDLGYGDRGSPPRIPGGATLVFEVELLEIK